MDKIDPRLLFYAALGLGVLYVVSKAAGAAGDAAQALGGFLGDTARTADDAVAGGVGAVGGIFGLPTPSETIDDPVAVRYIIDTEGTFEASKRGTAMAFLRALNMPAGSGSGRTPTFTPEQITRIGGPGLFDIPGYGEQAAPSFSSTIGGTLF